MRKTFILLIVIAAVLFILCIGIRHAKAENNPSVTVTLWFSGTIQYYDGTRWQTFMKPTMTMSEGEYLFHFSDSQHPPANITIAITGQFVEKTIAYIRLLKSDGITGQQGATAQWWDYGKPAQPVQGTTDSNGVLLCVMDGKHTDVLIDVTFEDATAPFKRQNPTTNSFYIFQMTKVTVELRNHIGDIISETGTVVYYWPYGKGEREFGTLTNGIASKDLLMPSGAGFLYKIKDFHKSSQQVGPTKNTTVVFQTGKVIDGGFGCDKYWQYGGQTANFIDGIELLPGNFYFKDIQTNTVKNLYVKRGLVLILNTGTYLTPQIRYYLKVKTNPENITAIPGEGWYDKGVNVTLLAPEIVLVDEGKRYKFHYWEVDAVPYEINPITITIDTNHTAIAYYLTQYYLKVISPFGTPSGEGWYDEGTYAYAGLNIDIVMYDGTRHLFVQWTGDATGTNYSQSDFIYMNSSKTAIAQWKTQYYLTVISPYDTPGGEGWYDECDTAYAVLLTGLDYVNGVAYGFIGWSGDASGWELISNPIIMNSPKTAIALWEASPVYGDVRTIGFWKHQVNVWYFIELQNIGVKVKGVGAAQIPEEELINYLTFIDSNSEYFKDKIVVYHDDGTINKLKTLENIYNILRTPTGPNSMKMRSEQQLLAVWLNLARKAFFWNTGLDQSTEFVYQQYALETIGEAIKFCEQQLLTNGDFEAIKDICDSINNKLGILWGT